ncbi:hypothetical protein [Clostridium sp. LS]|uniref:hypothetical protein n=1 Tax=Clostridium sp. LS TaxID=1352601 RepID=UPI0015D4ECAC|nr:hypothetical protein [Clostridium sp. LS]
MFMKWTFENKLLKHLMPDCSIYACQNKFGASISGYNPAFSAFSEIFIVPWNKHLYNFG